MNLPYFELSHAQAQPAGVGVRAEHCLRQGNRRVACSRCADLCPVGAITLAAAGPLLNGEQCIRCGLCLPVCPTAVFELPSSPESSLVKVVNQQAQAAVQVVCWAAPASTGSAWAPVVVSHSGCLGALASDQLLELTRLGVRPLWLDDRGCGGCPLGAVHAQLVARAAAVNTLLAGFGRPACIRLASNEPEPAPSAPLLRKLDGRQPRLSRRSFLTALRPTAQCANVAAPRPVCRLVQGRLQQQLRSLPPAAGAGPGLDTRAIPFARPVVDSAVCTACGLCSRACPTGALAFAANASAPNGDRFQLAFQIGACIDCGLCAAACPTTALRFAATIAPSDLQQCEPITLADGPLAACPGCGTPVAAIVAAVPTRCHVCRTGQHGRGDNRARTRQGLFDQVAAFAARSDTAGHPAERAIANPSRVQEGARA